MPGPLFGFDFSRDWIQFLLLLLFKLDFFVTLLIGLNAGSLSLDGVCSERSSNWKFIMLVRWMQKYHNSIQFNNLLSNMPLKMWSTSQPSNLHSSLIIDQSLPTHLIMMRLLDSIKLQTKHPEQPWKVATRFWYLPLHRPFHCTNATFQDHFYKIHHIKVIKSIKAVIFLRWWSWQLSQLCLFITALRGWLCISIERDAILLGFS